MGMNGPSWARRSGEVRIAYGDALRARSEASRLTIRAFNLQINLLRSLELTPTLGMALDGGYHFLQVLCRRCRTRAAIPLDKLRRPRTDHLDEIAARLRCKCGRRGAEIRQVTILEHETTHDLARTLPPGQIGIIR